jgi:hypothetical protein
MSLFRQSTHFGTPLGAAAITGHVAIVELILGRYLDMGLQKFDRWRRERGSALIDASQGTNELIVPMLLDPKFNFNYCPVTYRLASKAAAESGDVKTLALLVGAHRKHGILPSFAFGIAKTNFRNNGEVVRKSRLTRRTGPW